jgi:hypothetical protein
MMLALIANIVDIDVLPVLTNTTVLNVPTVESMPHIVDVQPVSMMMVSLLIVNHAHLNAKLANSKTDNQSVKNVLKEELTLHIVNVLMELGITTVLANFAVTHVPNVPTNGPVPNVLTSEPQPTNAHVHPDTMKNLAYHLVMPVLSDVPFVKEMLKTVLNVPIPDLMLLFVTNVQKTISMI